MQASLKLVEVPLRKWCEYYLGSRVHLGVGGEGLELHIRYWPYMDSINLDSPSILGMWSDNY